MNGIGETLHRLYERSEDYLGRSWPAWLVAILFYAAASNVLMTRASFKTPLHFVVFVMAFTILVLTLIKVEWAILGLVAMIAFTRPGFSIGPMRTFHVSGFNVALVGVWIVYLARYSIDREMASLGPIVRKTAVDKIAIAYVCLVTISALLGINKNVDPVRFGDVISNADPQMRVLLYYKEQILYFAWFYLVITLTRKPRDLRRLAVVFAIGGLLVALVGLYNRFTGSMQLAGADAQAEAGIVGGRLKSVGFLGVGHPNFFGALLLMTLPMWFFIVDHVKGFFRRLFCNLAILSGFLALLFTFSRSAWIGMVAGLAMLGITDRRALVRIVFFLMLFMVVAQGL